ncbi:hypothetical protein ACUXAV_006512 [Cupriavidus metallidurans]|jgi:hypothetical protein|uniref:Lipoprotein transmembrane n=1 Tax=Cupriavidus metallidurans (strain ATCC 43123 / DSM 2839 / NBRC 102507 / CH34) TaxID=266264 RepID=Q5NV37_CUPMC|nr:hypothetical protein [Cupriavidus metallidurans]ABF13146.1 lipoprotein transmembrane [Cupriavidus metallidurans CH34]MDE4922946.1 hypothetical protein [Cupriavidus metallidurans]QGS27431.1 hypothetical protein FOB83_00355 [Cupriavidus metallidurans]CAI30175.1 putative transmembrane lipoprotein [Cupriavidus metallidurans CH34]
MQKTKIALSIVSAAALLTLAACGGGGGDSAAVTQQPATPTPPTPSITVQGSAAAVQADPLAVVYVPHTETSTRPAFQSISHAAFPAQYQKATQSGAYTQVGIDANSLITLTSGKVVDVTGNGDYAIGRWTDGSSTIGAVNVNQGDHYAVGTPLKLLQVLGIGKTLACTQIASTSPTAVSGNFPVGKLNSATAVIDLNGPTLQTLNLDVAIGSDAHATANIVGTVLNGVTQSNGVLHHVQTLGTSQSQPLLAIGYAMPTPSSGDVTGVVILKCQ